MATPRGDNVRDRKPKEFDNTSVTDLVNENDYDQLIKLSIKSFDLFKKQTYADALLKEGEINGLESIKSVLFVGIKTGYLAKERKKKSFKSDEQALKKFSVQEHGKASPDILELYNLTSSKIELAHTELITLKAIERIMSRMDDDLENNLTSMSILEDIEKNKALYSPDVEARVNAGKCGLKRPGGRQKFVCSNDVIPGTKYCTEHLKEFEPDKYVETLKDPVKTEE